MIIESFTIRNYRSIKSLEIRGLAPLNVFFGKNNVGKSNILRALHLAFYCLRNDRIYLPDTMFYNRNIYRPIEVTVDLKLGELFRAIENTWVALRGQIDSVHSVLAGDEDIFRAIVEDVDQFLLVSESFVPLERLRLSMELNYNEETCDMGMCIADLQSDYSFDYGKYRMLYKQLRQTISNKVNDKIAALTKTTISELAPFGLRSERVGDCLMRLGHEALGPSAQGSEYLEAYLDRSIAELEDPGQRRAAFDAVSMYKEKLAEQSHRPQLMPFAKTFALVEGYFKGISDNFILIPNKEYFPKGPLSKKEANGEHIQLFDVDRFKDRLASLIESPGKRERELIQRFNSVFSTSYGDLGELEIRKFRDEVFAIFDTGFSALPIENQGLGIQDLFLYLANVILFDSAIKAIEEPEGGLSAENQRILHGVLEDVCSASDTQLLISSHSEEFETLNSYVIEMGSEGTEETSRRQREQDYEEKIQGVLVKRRLAQEKEEYEAALRELAERQIMIDILRYISDLPEHREVDPKEISDALGYDKQKVQEVLTQVLKARLA